MSVSRRDVLKFAAATPGVLGLGVVASSLRAAPASAGSLGTLLDGLDSLLSIVQMPAGVPVATVSIGGAGNAGLLAVRMLGAANPQLRARIVAFQDRLADVVAAKDAELQRLAGKLTRD